MKIVTALTFLLSFSLQAHANEWVKTKSINNVEIWNPSGIYNIRIVKDVVKTERQLPLSHFHSPIFKKDLQENKKDVLKHLGITEWIVEINEISELNQEIIVDMSGTYLSPSQVRVFFLERQVYGPSSMTSFLYTSPSSPDKSSVYQQFDRMKK